MIIMIHVERKKAYRLSRSDELTVTVTLPIDSRDNDGNYYSSKYQHRGTTEQLMSMNEESQLCDSSFHD